MELESKIFVAGHRGLVGSAVVRNLSAKGYRNLILRTRTELDLENQSAVQQFFRENKIDYVIDAAAKVGGILANQTQQVEFLYENMITSFNVIRAAADHGVKKLLYLGSSCVYPRLAPQPITEAALLTSELEPTNEGYALAKIASLKLCEKYFRQYGKRFISAMPTNLYGPGDNFHPEHSHVIPGLMRRFHEAKQANEKSVTIWGSGKPRREFLYVDDLAEALFVLMDRYEEPTTINIGAGEDIAISELAELIRQVVGFKGDIVYDTSKPDGTPRKMLDVSRITALGWEPKVNLKKGLETAYRSAVTELKFR